MMLRIDNFMNQEESEKIYTINKDYSLALKGMAIILMIIHHFYGYPSWLIQGIEFPFSNEVAMNISIITKLCVGIFAFLTGWIYALDTKKSLKKSLHKITRFLIDYWIVFISTLMIVCAIGIPLNKYNVLMELIGLKTVIMCFCWYVLFYIIVMLVMPIGYFIIEKLHIHTFIKEIVVWMFIYYLFTQLEKLNGQAGLTIYFPMVIVGYLLSKYHLLDRIWRKLHEFNQITRISIGIICIFASSYTVLKWSYIASRIYSGWFCIPIIIFGISLLRIERSGYLYKILKILGKYSMNIWFVHGIFLGEYTREYFQPYAYFLKNPVLVVIWILIICTLVSTIFSYIQQKIHYVIKI